MGHHPGNQAVSGIDTLEDRGRGITQATKQCLAYGIDTLEDRGRGITLATKQGLVESLVDHRMKPNCMYYALLS